MPESAAVNRVDGYAPIADYAAVEAHVSHIPFVSRA